MPDNGSRRRGRWSAKWDFGAEIGDQAHSSIFADVADAAHRSTLVRKGLGDGYHCSVRRFEPESEARVLIDEEFKHPGHAYPPEQRAARDAR
ncbi:hypothetical protein GCM10023346_33360 [Arthrobacter gyeryongensis]|uniref:Uncharacterized protein n=1 Tax=Arthrobacter gyeryongensis TaxID=1650592 RepID=A0ABP9SK18_9MICC